MVPKPSRLGFLLDGADIESPSHHRPISQKVASMAMPMKAKVEKTITAW
jgi:hypothetical protein